jgi:hypothetical protein
MNQPALFDITAYVWVVSPHQDKIRKAPRKKFEAQERYNAKFGWEPYPAFDTERAALDFMVARAAKRVPDLEANIRQVKKDWAAANRRLTKCQAALDAHIALAIVRGKL